MINTLWKICSTCKSNGDCKNPSWDGKNNCKDYEPYFVTGIVSEASQFATGKFNIDKSLLNTLQIDRCERIIFRDKTLDFVFELPEEYYKNIDTIIINGVKFKKEKI